jgi:hypothetical protein
VRWPRAGAARQSAAAAAGREHVLGVGPLSQEAVGELVAELAGGRPGPGLLRLAGEAAGNPL